jgi:hypothetical protein
LRKDQSVHFAGTVFSVQNYFEGQALPICIHQ